MRQSLHIGLVALVGIGLTTSAFAQATTVKPAAPKPATTAAKAAPKAAAAKNTMPPAIDAAFKKAYPNDNTTNFELSLKGAAVKAVELTPEGKWMSPKPAAKK